MIHKAGDLSMVQKTVVEALLGRPVLEDEAISICAVDIPRAPAWLQTSWESAIRHGVDRLSTEEIEAEIQVARNARRGVSPSLPQ